MKNVRIASILTLCSLFGFSAMGGPNLVVINVDDLGWNDVNVLPGIKSPYYTPHIEKLARDGMVFTDGYAACPVCSPTRASLLTGRTTAALKLTTHIAGALGAGERRMPKEAKHLPAQSLTQLPLDEVTFAEVLKKKGYRTGYIGKWHLAGEGSAKDRSAMGVVAPEFHPDQQGFDVNIGGCAYGQPASYFDPYKNAVLKDRKAGEYLTDRLADEAVNFITDKSDKSFLLYLNPYSVHTPIKAPKERVALVKKKSGVSAKMATYATMIYSVDLLVGQVVEAVRSKGLVDSTMILFTSDNGGHMGNAPLRDNKGTLYEGGIRVPLVVAWPGRIKSGSVCHEPVISYDLFPTLLSAADCLDDMPQGIEGSDMMPLLTGKGAFQRKAPLLWHYPHYHHGGMRSVDMGTAVRDGAWKYIFVYKTGEAYLFNLEKDRGEQKNLAKNMPERAGAMKKAMLDRLNVIGAHMPSER